MIKIGNGKRPRVRGWGGALIVGNPDIIPVFEFCPVCLNVKSMRSTRCYKKLNSAGADSENDLGGSSETICTTSDLTFTRRRSATA